MDCKCFTNGLQSLCNILALVSQLLFNRFAIDLQSLCNHPQKRNNIAITKNTITSLTSLSNAVEPLSQRALLINLHHQLEASDKRIG
jgi:hypothetical protein